MAVRNTRELEKGLSPERRQRIAERVKEMEAEMLLSELRRQEEMSQAELAQAMGISQPNVSKLEGEDDMQISTLRRLVTALGGKLRISVEIPGKGEFTLSQFDSKREEKSRLEQLVKEGLASGPAIRENAAYWREVEAEVKSRIGSGGGKPRKRKAS